MEKIMTNSITKFKVQASSNLWKGLSRQEHKFHVPLGELIDNSLSARIKKNIGDRKESIFIEIIIEEKNDGTISLVIADNGTGMSLSFVSPNALLAISLPSIIEFELDCSDDDVTL